jgi:hypothetical protein
MAVDEIQKQLLGTSFNRKAFCGLKQAILKREKKLMFVLENYI